jgi:hypothetical protein
LTNNKYNSKLIAPKSDEFTRNPEYFIYKSKRENFRGLNLSTTLSSLKIDSKPFYSKEAKVKIKDVNIKDGKDNLENTINLKNFKNKPFENHNEKLKESNIKQKPNDCIIKNTEQSTCTNEDLKDTLNKLRIISMGEIKEYIPKNFKIVKK